jgi:2-polyprenyl-6-methoxyphenol hydroxylase-like FAD-dependent oxidoreductase
MQRAVVVGGSIAGLCCARVLADAFDEVIVLDRDRFPDVVGARAGAPQARHVHVLLKRGLSELEKHFPGFTADMVAAGAVRMDSGLNMAVRRQFGWQAIGEIASVSLCASRDLLEWTVRSALGKHRNVRLDQGSQVVGLDAEPDGKPRVTGVRVRDAQRVSRRLPADLVVDASGRNSRAADWLQEIGLQPPRIERVDAGAGYASRWYRPPPHSRRPAHWWWTALWVDAQPGLPRGAVIFPTEGDVWVVTAAGVNGDYPPTEEAEFMRFLGTLASPAIAATVACCEPISPIYGNRSMTSSYRHYEKWRRELTGFLAIGDSVCAFNPIYGQGMTSAAVCASILAAELERRAPRKGFERRFFRRQAQFLDQVWAISTVADFLWPDTVGERPYSPRALTRYFELAFESAHHDSRLLRHVMPVYDLTGSVNRYFEPRFACMAMLAATQRHLRERLFGPVAIPDFPPLPDGFQAHASNPPRERPASAAQLTSDVTTSDLRHP